MYETHGWIVSCRSPGRGGERTTTQVQAFDQEPNLQPSGVWGGALTIGQHWSGLCTSSSKRMNGTCCNLYSCTPPSPKEPTQSPGVCGGIRARPGVGGGLGVWGRWQGSRGFPRPQPRLTRTVRGAAWMRWAGRKGSMPTARWSEGPAPAGPSGAHSARGEGGPGARGQVGAGRTPESPGRLLHPGSPRVNEPRARPASKASELTPPSARCPLFSKQSHPSLPSLSREWGLQPPPFPVTCGERPTCREKVRARSVSTCPLGGSTISWDRRMRLEPWEGGKTAPHSRAPLPTPLLSAPTGAPGQRTCACWPGCRAGPSCQGPLVRPHWSRPSSTRLRTRNWDGASTATERPGLRGPPAPRYLHRPDAGGVSIRARAGGESSWARPGLGLGGGHSGRPSAQVPDGGSTRLHLHSNHHRDELLLQLLEDHQLLQGQAAQPARSPVRSAVPAPPVRLPLASHLPSSDSTSHPPPTTWAVPAPPARLEPREAQPQLDHHPPPLASSSQSP